MQSYKERVPSLSSSQFTVFFPWKPWFDSAGYSQMSDRTVAQQLHVHKNLYINNLMDLWHKALRKHFQRTQLNFHYISWLKPFYNALHSCKNEENYSDFPEDVGSRNYQREIVENCSKTAYSPSTSNSDWSLSFLCECQLQSVDKHNSISSCSLIVIVIKTGQEQ